VLIERLLFSGDNTILSQPEAEFSALRMMLPNDKRASRKLVFHFIRFPVFEVLSKPAPDC
jgi:hypothetical protein